jgi:hypothetical protein
MAQRRGKSDDRGTGVILRDRGGAVYAIPAAVLARYRVPDDLAAAVTALAGGDETAGFDQDVTVLAASRETSGSRGDRRRRRVERILAAFQESRSSHLSNTPATWLLR